MKKAKPDRDRLFKIAICCTKKEYEAMLEWSRQSTCRSFSEYARKVLLKKPVAITHRNLSIDSLIDTVNGIRNVFDRLLDHQSLNRSDLVQITTLILEIKRLFYKIADECILK